MRGPNILLRASEITALFTKVLLKTEKRVSNVDERNTIILYRKRLAFNFLQIRPIITLLTVHN